MRRSKRFFCGVANFGGASPGHLGKTILQMARIHTLTFKYGPRRAEPGETVHLPTVLLFVGPNESGKTLATLSIQEWYDGSHETIEPRLFRDASFKILDRNEAIKFLEPLKLVEYSEAEYSKWENEPDLKSNATDLFLREFCTPNFFNQKSWRSNHLGRLRRMASLNSITAITGDSDASTIIPGDRYRWVHHLLLADRARLDKVNEIVYPASGYYVAVQKLQSGQLHLQLNPEQPPIEMPGVIISKTLQDYYDRGIGIDSFGDGLRAFIGLVLSIFPFEHKLVLLDEPELHLHPPLANRFAQHLVREIAKRSGQLIVATHSADFVAGCVSSTDDIAMARLTYSKKSDHGTASVVSKSALEPFVMDRVVRNTDALDGIFHDATVVVEGAFDKIAYTEFNRCLQQQRPSCGIRDSHFVSAGSYAQALKVAQVMRKTGTPTAALLDFDALYSEGIKWEKATLDRLQIPHDDQKQILELLSELQLELQNLFTADEAFKVRLKRQGLRLLDNVLRELVPTI